MLLLQETTQHVRWEPGFNAWMDGAWILEVWMWDPALGPRPVGKLVLKFASMAGIGVCAWVACLSWLLEHKSCEKLGLANACSLLAARES